MMPPSAIMLHGSGSGFAIAANVNISMTAQRQPFSRDLAFTTPIRFNAIITTGKRNAIANARIRRIANVRYVRASMRLEPPSGVIAVNTVTAWGKIAQPPMAPAINSGAPAPRKSNTYFFSVRRSPGATNAQSW